MREESALGSMVLVAQSYQVFPMPGVMANVENFPGLESMTRFAVHTTSRNFGGANHFVCWTIHRYVGRKGIGGEKIRKSVLFWAFGA